MNRPVIIYYVALVILLLTIFTGCKQEAPPPSTVPFPGPSTPNGESSSQYTNSDYDFSFNFFDTEFQLVEDFRGANVAILGPYLWDMQTRINIVVIIRELPKKISLDDFVKDDIAKSKSKLEGYEVLERYSTEISGLPAEVVAFTFPKQVGEETAKFNNIYVAFIKDNTIYMIKYDVPEEFHEDYLNNFNSVISSFRFQ
jgi:hypothetical protein